MQGNACTGGTSSVHPSRQFPWRPQPRCVSPKNFALDLHPGFRWMRRLVCFVLSPLSPAIATHAQSPSELIRLDSTQPGRLTNLEGAVEELLAEATAKDAPSICEAVNFWVVYLEGTDREAAVCGHVSIVSPCGAVWSLGGGVDMVVMGPENRTSGREKSRAGAYITPSPPPLPATPAGDEPARMQTYKQ